MVGSGRVIVPEMTAAQRLTMHSGKLREFMHEFAQESV